MAAKEEWLDLTDTERFDALWFCRCADSRMEIDHDDEYWMCGTCGTRRRLSDMGVEEGSRRRSLI
jgi:hypothetical protein